MADQFELDQIQALLNNNEKYDILLFVQIPRDYFHRDVLAYLESHASYRGTGSNPEFMYMACHLEDEAVPYFERWKDKKLAEQCRLLANDLKSVQYVHVIS